jgi:hypothetical protein
MVLSWHLLLSLSSYLASSFGWNPNEKKREMFDPLSRFILVSPKPGNTQPEPSYIGAYVMFRFDIEEGEAVVYWCVKFISLTLDTDKLTFQL